MVKKYYAVAKGRKIAIYTDWDECSANVRGYSGAIYKRFNTITDAQQYINSGKVYNKPQHMVTVNNTIIQRPATKSYNSFKVYTDGACKNNQNADSRTAGYGVFFGDNDYRNVSGSLPDSYKQTNQAAELYAINMAYNYILKDAREWGNQNRYTIVTDSKNSIDCLTLWYKTWENNGWTNSRGRPVENQEIVQQILRKQKFVNQLYQCSGWPDLEFKHVQGHSGDYGNEMADTLANDGAAKYGYQNSKT